MSSHDSTTSIVREKKWHIKLFRAPEKDVSSVLISASEKITIYTPNYPMLGDRVRSWKVLAANCRLWCVRALVLVGSGRQWVGVEVQGESCLLLVTFLAVFLRRLGWAPGCCQGPAGANWATVSRPLGKHSSWQEASAYPGAAEGAPRGFPLVLRVRSHHSALSSCSLPNLPSSAAACGPSVHQRACMCVSVCAKFSNISRV